MCDRSHAIPLTLQICTALRYFATGSYQNLIGDANTVSQPSVSRIVKKFSSSLTSKSGNFIRMPATNVETGAAKQGFYNVASFPNVVGAIDGTHIKILAPREGEEAFVNRKGFHSINCQMVMDSNFIITNLVALWPGSCHDSRILRMSGLWDHFEGGNLRLGILLGDSGYPNRNWLLTPFLDPNNHNERRYNR